MVRPCVVLAAASAAAAVSCPAFAQVVTTSFTYQARLLDDGQSATGPYDFEVRCFDAPASGNQQGPTLTFSDALVSEGLITLSLDFGAVFTGERRWIQVSVRPGPSGGAFTVLPRQELTFTPHAGVATQRVFIADAAQETQVDIRGTTFGGTLQLLGPLSAPYLHAFPAAMPGGGGTLEMSSDDSSISLNSNIGTQGASIEGANGNGSTTFRILSGGAVSAKAAGGVPIVEGAQVNLLGPMSGNTLAQLTLGESADSTGGVLRLFDDATAQVNFFIGPSTGGGSIITAQTPGGTRGSHGFMVDTDSDLLGNPALFLTGGPSAFAIRTGLTGDAAVTMPLGAVSAVEIFDEPGVANTSGNNVPLGAAFVSVLSRSITVPGPGFVLALGHSDLSINHVMDEGGVFAVFGVSDSASSLPANLDMQVNIPSSAGSGVWNFPASSHGLFDVAGAGTFTFHLTARFNGNGMDSAVMFDNQLTLIYLSTAYGSVVPNMRSDDSNGMGNHGSLLGAPVNANDLRAEQNETIRGQQARMQAELDRVNAEVATLRALIEARRPQD